MDPGQVERKLGEPAFIIPVHAFAVAVFHMKVLAFGRLKREPPVCCDVDTFGSPTFAEDDLTMDVDLGLEGRGQTTTKFQSFIHQHGEQRVDGEFVAGVHHMELLNQRGRQEIQRQRLPEIQWVFTRPQDFIKSRHHTLRQCFGRFCLSQPPLQVSFHGLAFLCLLVHLVQSPTDDSNLCSQHGQTRQDDRQHQGLFQLVGCSKRVRCWSVLCNDPVEGDHVLKQPAVVGNLVLIHPVGSMALLLSAPHVDGDAG
mmetsp:Transcript_4315/g.10031  ORF Transcript_4315/g.10031 Transcript_4315/m.10031 type:complete len:255 (+) Transcript_4315:1757-2521(+)